MSSDYWFPWYPTAYKRDAGHLDLAADGAYRRLIDWYMETREPIKKDAAKLAHIIGATASQFQAIWPQIEGFFTLTDGFLHLKRCNIELDRQDSRASQRSEAGRRSAEKRKQQYQLLANDRSTTVQRPFNDPRDIEDRRGQDSINITTTVPVAAREPEPVEKSVTNGHNHGPKNGVKLDIDPLRASRALPGNGKVYTPAEKHAAFEQRTLQFALAHYSTDRYAEMVALQLSDNPTDKIKRKEVFNAADADYQARKAAGTLQPTREQ